MMAVTKRRAIVTLPTETQIQIVREFDAPKHLVYQAWTTPALIKRWWSAKRGRVVTADVDLREGGRWRWVLLTDRGFEVAFSGEYREVRPDERLVYTERYEAMPDGSALCTLTLIERDGRTIMTVLVEHSSRADRDAHVNSGMESGMQDAMELLDEVLGSLAR